MNKYLTIILHILLTILYGLIIYIMYHLYTDLIDEFIFNQITLTTDVIIALIITLYIVVDYSYAKLDEKESNKDYSLAKSNSEQKLAQKHFMTIHIIAICVMSIAIIITIYTINQSHVLT